MRATIVIAAVGIAIGWPAEATRAASAPAPTEVHHYVVPATLPSETQNGSCAARSVAAAMRPDVLRCLSGGVLHDPCFVTPRTGVALCDVDPRQDAVGILVKVAPAPAGAIDAPAKLSWVWFIELTDGSACRPVTGVPREFDGEAEIYTCRFSPTGDLDAVLLGEVDDSAPAWTIKRASLNKKFTPQTIKSLTVAAVKAVWQ